NDGIECYTVKMPTDLVLNYSMNGNTGTHNQSSRLPDFPDERTLTEPSIDSDFEVFGLNLYRELTKLKPKENIFLSPASIAIALSMTTAGTNGTTLKQLMSVLNVQTIGDMNVRAHKIASLINLSDSKEMKLKLANNIFIQIHYNISQNYKKLLEDEYLSSITAIDYENKPDESRNEINQWVEQQTNSLIKDLISPTDITSATKFILVNCIYFKGKLS
ncbi:unnamed protein product, partial [Didymodactylos carnosus]